MKRIFVILAFLLSVNLFATNNIVIYNNNLALISENFKMEINKGIKEYQLSGIPQNIISDSLSLKFPNDVRLIEQNYQYDVFNQYNLLKANIGKIVQYQDAKDFIQKGILLSVEGSYSLININKNLQVKNATPTISVINNNKIMVQGIPKGMVIEPSIVFLANSKTHYPSQEVKMRYLTTGFSWTSNYVLSIDKSNRMYLNAWVKLSNNTNVDIKDYKLTLLAGDVRQNNRHTNRNIRYKNVDKMAMMSGGPMPDMVKESSFAGYHLYDIPYKVTIKQKTTKQINFINKSIKEYKKKSVLDVNNIWAYKKDTRVYFNQVFEIQNTKDNNLGIPLPKGNIRVYQENKNKQDLFIGENRIANIAKNETVKINIGKDFDTICKLKTIKIKADKYQNINDIQYSILLKNEGKLAKIYKLNIKNKNIYYGSNRNRRNNVVNKSKSMSDCGNTDECSLKMDNNYFTYSIKLEAGKSINIKTNIIFD